MNKNKTGPKKNKTLVLSTLDIQEILCHFGVDWTMQTLIERLRVSIMKFTPEEVSIPVRSGFNYEKPQPGLIEWMPLYNQEEQVLIKVVGYHPSNPTKFNLPTIISTISEYDTNTGHLCAIIDGVFATAIRTAAASAVASKLLASPQSSTLGLIGCGAQAVTQLHALTRCFNLKRVLIYDIDSNALSSFEKRCSVLNLEIEFLKTDITEIVRSSDILCTSTSIEIGAGPLFSNLETKHNLHINAVGSDFPGKIEIPADLLRKSFVCPDFIEQAMVEGECQQLDINEIGADLVEVVKNADKYSYLQNERTVFDSTGWALEDKVVMDLLLDLASELNLGTELEIEQLSSDTKNPYDFLNYANIEPESAKSQILNAISVITAKV